MKEHPPLTFYTFALNTLTSNSKFLIHHMLFHHRKSYVSITTNMYRILYYAVPDAVCQNVSPSSSNFCTGIGL